MNRTIFICIAVLAISISSKISAQRGEQLAIDSLSKIVNSEAEPQEKIKPMTDISRLYTELGDSLKAEKFLNQARTLAQKQKDGGYMIYVLNRELANTWNIYPRNITRIYKIIDSIYAAIPKTANSEAQAWGYYYIAGAKGITDSKYDYNDYLLSLSIAEKLPEKSVEKYKLLFNIYRRLYIQNREKGKKTDAEKYLDLMYQTAGKTENKDILCSAMNLKLAFMLSYSPQNTNLISQNSERLEEFITKNENDINMATYGDALMVLKFNRGSSAHYKELFNLYIENSKKLAGNNHRIKRIYISYNILDAIEQKNYARAAELYLQKIEVDKIIQPNVVSDSYVSLSEVYSNAGEYQQALEAMAKGFDYYKQHVDAQMEEQRQLAEIKFEVEKKDAALSLIKTRSTLYYVIGFSVIGFLISAVIHANRRNKRLKLEKENVELISEKMAYEKDKIGKKLIVSTTELERKEQLLEKTKNMNKEQISRTIRNEQKKAKITSDYVKLFEETRPEFFDRL
ncbi:MAG: hypothetical protein LBE36_05060 [Flavobacteriaceae bacterium]|jgi:hypothetical protein|nr:hypothetical protein [Flavobacteriaceae bacterium]